MKKITSFLLMLTMLISIIYLPGVQIKTLAEESSPEDELEGLPDGTKMTPGKYIFTYENRMPVEENDVGGIIRCQEDFETIQPGGKYSLGCDITLENWEPLFFEASYNEAQSVRFDGGGYTITTDDMLFYRLPKNSVFANFVIAGDISKPSTDILGTTPSNNKKEHPFHALGTLCSHMWGGTVKNVINKANVTAKAESENSNYEIRVSGLIGICTEEPVLIQNCHNRGNIWGSVHGTRYAVAGLLGYASCSKLYIMGCRNDGQIINAYTSNKQSKYAGGIVGTKTDLENEKGKSNWYIIGSSSVLPTDKAPNGTDMIQAMTYPGSGFNGCAALPYDDTYGNTIYVEKATPVSSPEDFSRMTGDGTYYLTETFNITIQNKNHFVGKLYGGDRYLTAQVPPFAYDDSNNCLVDVEVTVEGWTKIMTAPQFLAIVNDGSSLDDNDAKNINNRYYLGADIDLATPYPNWKGPSAWSESDSNRKKATNAQPTIILDGCGYTVKTARTIFPELPGGGEGNDGTHSIIRNLVIEGNVKVDSGFLAEYDNESSAGALVGKSNGGIYENITNKANITLTSEMDARIGGIVGSVFNDDIVMTNCVNQGNVIAPVSGNSCGAGGILAFVGYDQNSTARGVNAKFINCTNQGSVTNNPKNMSSHVYAGGIVGVKYIEDTTGYLIDCTNTGKIFAKTAYGSYYADRLQQNLHIIKSIPVRDEKELMQVSGKKVYSLANDITITNYNTNVFEGFLVGNNHTVTTPNCLFYDDSKVNLIGVNINPTNLVINGRNLDSYAIVATDENKSSAELIQNHLVTHYQITLPIYTPDDNYTGNAIYINLGNNYYNVTDGNTSSGKHKTRFGFDYEMNDSGYFEIYLDGKDDEETIAIVTDFINNKIPKGKPTTGYDFFADFGDKTFNYVFKSGLSSGITKQMEFVSPIDDGVRFIEKTYKNANNALVEVCILVIEAGADVSLEVVAAQTTSASECSNSAKCNNIHVNPSAQKTVGDFAYSVEEQGKDVIAAVNGGYFMDSAGCNTPWVLTVDGNAIREPRSGTDSDGYGSRWFGITYNGTPICGDHNSYNSYKSQLKYAVDGRYYLIKNGSYVHHSSVNGDTDARTAVGFNADGDIVIVSVAGSINDANNPGLSLVDMSQVFMDLDMDITYALNLGGGSSTAMMVDDLNGNLRLETPQYSSGVTNSEGKTDLTAQRKITDALVLVRNK